MKTTNKVTGFVSEIGAIVKQLWNAAKDCGYCCGIRFDSPEAGEHMPTPSSCCGVRV